MQNLLIDISRPLSRLLEGRLPTGVDRVCLAYVRHYRTHARALIFFRKKVWVFPRSVSLKLFDLLLHPPSRSGARLLRIILLQGATAWFPRRLRGALLLNLGHSNLDQPAYLDAIRQREFRFIYFVHDLIPVTHPEYCRPGQRLRHAKRIRQALSVASGVIVNSKATLADLASFAASEQLQVPPSACALLAPEPPPKPSASPLWKEPYFVMVGTLEPRKNYTLILQIWQRLAGLLGSQTPRLVLIGQRGWECENIVDLLERAPALQGVVLEMPECCDSEMATILHHSRALLFPSFVEGYGLPLAEALAAGVPVIASDLAVFREFAGEIPDYIDPLDGLGWMRAILDFAAPDSPRRAAQCVRLQRFAAPTWDAHFVSVENLLEELGHVPLRGSHLVVEKRPHGGEESAEGRDFF